LLEFRFPPAATKTLGTLLGVQAASGRGYELYVTSKESWL
jgi:hypothetical protein